MRAGEAHAPDAVDRAHSPEQLGEQRAALRDVSTVGVHVLTEQRHLGHPALGQEVHLGHDIVERPAHLGSAHRGHDAEGTRVVAPGLDVHPGRVGQLTHGARTQQGIGRRFGRRRVEDLHHGTLGSGSTQQLGCTGEVVRPEDDIDPAHLLLDQIPILLGQTASDGDLQAGTGVDQLLEPPKRAVEALVSVLPDAAGVEDDDIGLLHGWQRPPCRRPPGARPGAPSRVRSFGTRTCG